MADLFCAGDQSLANKFTSLMALLFWSGTWGVEVIRQSGYSNGGNTMPRPCHTIMFYRPTARSPCPTMVALGLTGIVRLSHTGPQLQPPANDQTIYIGIRSPGKDPDLADRATPLVPLPVPARTQQASSRALSALSARRIQDLRNAFRSDIWRFRTIR